MCNCNSCQMGRNINSAIESGDKEQLHKAFDELWNAYESESLDRQWLEMNQKEFTENEICIQEHTNGDQIRFVKILEQKDEEIFKVKPYSPWYTRASRVVEDREFDCHVSRLHKNKDCATI